MIFDLIDVLPKAELHLHIEGTLEPELMLRLAKKNKITLPYNNVEQIQDAYQFYNLQSFLDLYYIGADVLRDADDFYQLMMAYFESCHDNNIVHTEIMFDPQTHTLRGIPFDSFMSGFNKAQLEAKQKYNISSYLILCFLRHLDEQSALDTLEQSKDYLHMIKAVGLDSAEVGNPPEKFKNVFLKAKQLGLQRVAHAGEEGPAQYIWDAIKQLDVVRIDHGIRASDDPVLLQYLKDTQMPLTVCPLSNLKLKVFKTMAQHNIIKMLDAGLLVTVNSDDPSYFGGYLNENFYALVKDLNINETQVIDLCINSFKASFLPQSTKEKWINLIHTKQY
ncbi:MAG: adenosine deaminase [Saccharospirillaceae bacterium]|nr:adenosine deaminase [Saccharospirillaceae bacterium]